MKQANYSITIKIVYEKEASDAPYAAYIPEFDVSSCGKTEKKAIKNVKEVLDILINKARKDGRLTELLSEVGIVTDKKSVVHFPKIIVEPFPFSFSV